MESQENIAIKCDVTSKFIKSVFKRIKFICVNNLFSKRIKTKIKTAKLPNKLKIEKQVVDHLTFITFHFNLFIDFQTKIKNVQLFKFFFKLKKN